MNKYWKIVIPCLVLAVGGLLAALALARPVQRTIFRAPEAAGLELLLAEDLRAVDGVHGMWLEAGSEMLVVDHCPELDHRQVLEVLAARGSAAETVSSRRIHAVQACGFPAAAETGGGRVCRSGRPCAAGASWQELLSRWRGGN